MENNQTKACSICKIEKQLTDFGFVKGKPFSNCRECKRKKDRDWAKQNPDAYKARRQREYEKHAEKIKAKASEWYYANRERALLASRQNVLRQRDYVLHRQKEWYHRNKRHVIEKAREYRLSNAEKCHAYNVAYRVANLERIKNSNKIYYQRNKQKYTEHAANRRARKRGAQGSYTRHDVARILETQKSRCIYCKTSLRNGFHVDHIYPLSRGGTNSRENLQLLCRSCNSKKGAKHPIDYAQQIGMLL